MKKLILSTAAILVIGLSAYACDGGKCNKKCDKKGDKKECVQGKDCDKKSCIKDEKCEKKEHKSCCKMPTETVKPEQKPEEKK
jgi:hypothetical protein